MPDPQPTPTSNGAAPHHLDPVIAGARFAGMYMLHRLRGLGFSARVFEAGTDIGGTWYWDRYSGARCDIESLDYQYGFADELQREWNWSERYATQPEILRYADYVAEKFDLRRDMQFETRVTSAHYDEATNPWAVETDQGDHVVAQYCLIATGCLSASQIPAFKGRESFAGSTYHTGRWPHEGVDFSGQRVGIIGTGSSAIQSIPLIAEQADHLLVFQRTPNYSLPAHNQSLSDEQLRENKEQFAQLREDALNSRFGSNRTPPELSALEVEDDERRKQYEAGWEAGRLTVLMSFTDRTSNLDANHTAAEFVREKVQRDRERSHRRRDARPEGLPHRGEAHMYRYRLLRDPQRRQCHAH